MPGKLIIQRRPFLLFPLKCFVNNWLIVCLQPFQFCKVCHGIFSVSGNDFLRIERSIFLRSILSANGEPRYDRRIIQCFKSKIYLSFVRAVVFYGSECWPTTKDNEPHLVVMEMKIGCWTSGLIRYNHIRN